MPSGIHGETRRSVVGGAGESKNAYAAAKTNGGLNATYTLSSCKDLVGLVLVSSFFFVLFIGLAFFLLFFF